MYILEAFTIILAIGVAGFIIQLIFSPKGKRYCYVCGQTHHQWESKKEGDFSSYRTVCSKCERRKKL